MYQDEVFVTEIQRLQSEIAGRDALIVKRDERLNLFEDEVSRLHEIIREMKKRIYGPRKERWLDQDQLGLFNEAEVEALKPEEDEESEGVEVKPHVRKRGKRKPLPDNLPTEVRVIDLRPEEKVGPDGSPLVLRVVGKEISKKLEYTPASMSVIEYHRLKYEIVKDDGETGVLTAPPVPSIIPKGIATPSLLSGVVVNKYGLGLPLYRQEEMFKWSGVHLPRSTQGRWVVQAAQAARPIWNVLEEKLMSSPYVVCDETWTQVLKEDGKTAESQSFMWVRSNPSDQEKIALFDYDPSRAGGVAERLFADFDGVLQVDGYGGYNVLEKNPKITRIGCNMHGRRKFHEAKTAGADKGHSLAEQGLKFYQRLYDIEAKAKEQKLSNDERHELRQKESVPIWDEMKLWADANAKKVPPKSKIGKAFNYFLNEYEYLRGYLKAGHLEMDNGFVERAIKYFAIGRNNWLFSDTVEGAEASSLFYSFVVTARLNGVNPFDALTKIFTELPLAQTIEDFERLAGYILTRPPPS